LSDLVPYCPGPSFEGFAVLNRLYEALATSREFHKRAFFRNQPMSEQAQRFYRSDARITPPQGFEQDLADLCVAISSTVT
jgi:hypothetical protein